MVGGADPAKTDDPARVRREAPTGRGLAASGVVLFRLAGGQIAEMGPDSGLR